MRVEIVGVVKNFQYISAFQQPKPIAYLAFWQQDTANNWSHDSSTHVRVAGNAAAMLQIQRTIAAMDADVPVSEAQRSARASMPPPPTCGRPARSS
jgi:hypothetical protein